MITHQADPPYPRLGHGTLAHLRGFLAEEEVELVIILLSAVWDEVCVDECGVCGEERRDDESISSFSVQNVKSLFKIIPCKSSNLSHDQTVSPSYKRFRHDQYAGDQFVYERQQNQSHSNEVLFRA